VARLREPADERPADRPARSCDEDPHDWSPWSSTATLETRWASRP
jgi:hypothetical protein